MIKEITLDNLYCPECGMDTFYVKENSQFQCVQCNSVWRDEELKERAGNGEKEHK